MMTICPLMKDEDPPCMKRCRVIGEYDEFLPLDTVHSMMDDCVQSLADWQEVSLDEALSTLERMCLLLRGRVEVPISACTTMLEVASGTQEAISTMDDDRVWEVYLRIGDIHLSCNDMFSAESAYMEALLLNEESVEVWNNLGLSQKKRGSVKEARQSYEKALDLDPLYPQSWFNLGMIQFENGDLNQAKKSFLKVIKLDQENPVAFNNLGVILRQEGKLEEALQVINKSLELHPDYAKAWHNKGVALLGLDREEQGVKCIVHALELDPDMTPARQELEKRGYEVEI